MYVGIIFATCAGGCGLLSMTALKSEIKILKIITMLKIIAAIVTAVLIIFVAVGLKLGMDLLLHCF